VKFANACLPLASHEEEKRRGKKGGGSVGGAIMPKGGRGGFRDEVPPPGPDFKREKKNYSAASYAGRGVGRKKKNLKHDCRAWRRSLRGEKGEKTNFLDNLTRMGFHRFGPFREKERKKHCLLRQQKKGKETRIGRNKTASELF